MMPFIVKWPGVTKRGAATGISYRISTMPRRFWRWPGRRFPATCRAVPVPLLKGQNRTIGADIYYHYYEYPSVHMVPRHYGIRTQRYKLMHFTSSERVGTVRPQGRPGRTDQPLRQTGTRQAAERMKNRLPSSRSIEDNSDISEKPDSWKVQMRGKK